VTAISNLLVYLAVLLIASVLIWAATLYGASPLWAALVGLAIAAVGAFIVATMQQRQRR
jgi:positive regulator of sigma E activity